MVLSQGSASRMHSFIGSTAYLPTEGGGSERDIAAKSTIDAPAKPLPVQVLADEHATGFLRTWREEAERKKIKRQDAHRVR